MTRPATVSGTPYHRLARTDRYRWWKPLAELVLFVVFWVIATLVTWPLVEDSLDAEGIVGLAVLAVSLALLIPASLLAARVVRTAGSVMSVRGRFRLGWFVQAFALVLAIKALGVVVEGVMSEQAFRWPGLATFAPMFAAILVMITLQSAGEELAFRGTLLQALAAWIPVAWIPVVVSSVVFGLVHAPETWSLGIALAGSGLLMAIAAIKTGGLEAAIAMHAGSNVAAFGYEAAAGRSDVWLATLNTDISLASIVVSIAFDLTAFAAVLLLARRKGVARVAGDVRSG